MTECLFQYDRLYLNAAYHELDEHRHLLSHMIIGVSQRVRCSVNHYEFEADGRPISSPSRVTKLFSAMFWLLKGATR